MEKKMFDELLQSVKEMKAIRSGVKKPSRTFTFRAPDVKKIRRKLTVSQTEFASMIGVSVKTLQNWEQGRRSPRGPAQALLKIASINPEAVLAALHSK